MNSSKVKGISNSGVSKSSPSKSWLSKPRCRASSRPPTLKKLIRHDRTSSDTNYVNSASTPSTQQSQAGTLFGTTSQAQKPIFSLGSTSAPSQSTSTLFGSTSAT